MSPAATDLVEGEALPDGDEIARYCKPSAYNLDLGEPSFLAFMKRLTENDLSVNRLQFFLGLTRSEAVDRIRLEVKKHTDLRLNGRFAVFNVAEAKAVGRELGVDIGVIYTPKACRPSHSSIAGLPADYEDEVRLAAGLLRLITQDAIFEAVL